MIGVVSTMHGTASKNPRPVEIRADSISVGICLYLWCVNRLVAGNAAELISQKRLHHRRVRRIGSEVFRRTVTLQAVCVRKRLVEFNLLRHFQKSIVSRHVAHACQLGFNGTQEAVIGMTGIALIIKDPAVAKMHRGQGFALWIVQIVHPRRHSMTISAETHMFGPLERERKRGKSKHDRCDSENN